MIGIYQILNKINKHCYIGQSIKIEERWKHHIQDSKDISSHSYYYPLQRAIRKYGLENFNFIVLEECSQTELNEKESYWANIYKPEYNQIECGLQGKPITQSPALTKQQVEEIQQILLNDKEGKISHSELAKKYKVHKDTIRNINVGRTWFNENLTYPLHLGGSDNRRRKKEYYCIDCGKLLSNNKAQRCNSCEGKRRAIKLEDMPITREELKNLIRTIPFTQIGLKFKISDNAIRKWCIKFNLPTTKKEIKQYTDEEWAII